MTEKKREAFVFYRSYYEAMQFLPPEERCAVYDAIFAYALDDAETELPGALAVVFQLIRHSLDTGKRKAESGRKGGIANSRASREQTEANESNPEAIKNKKQEIKNEKQEIKNKNRERRPSAPRQPDAERSENTYFSDPMTYENMVPL